METIVVCRKNGKEMVSIIVYQGHAKRFASAAGL